jgi:acyl-coenzyme A thioesterase PaaI-like protein
VSIPLVYATGPETLFGVGHVERHDGTVRGSMPSGTSFVGTDGRPSVGALGVLIDNVLGYSIIDSLEHGTWSVSTEIWLHLLAPVPTDGGQLRASARSIQRGSFATGTILDDRDGLVGACSQRGRAVAGPPLDPADLPPFELPTDAAGVVDLLGLHATGEVLAMRVTPVLENPRRMLHGGISLCASEVAATRSRRLAGSDLATSSMHIVHSRAIPAGSVVEFHPVTRHAGGSLWVTDIFGVVDGRTSTIARVSAERPAPDH